MNPIIITAVDIEIVIVVADREERQKNKDLRERRRRNMEQPSLQYDIRQVVVGHDSHEHTTTAVGTPDPKANADLGGGHNGRCYLYTAHRWVYQ